MIAWSDDLEPRLSEAGPARGIAEFLRARLDEDEREARVCLDHWLEEPGTTRRHWGWERQLREVETHRRLLAVHDVSDARWAGFPRADREEHYCREDGQTAPCRTLLALTAVYADHPDYDPAWGA